jgi:O-antigen biosynthesis protein
MRYLRALPASDEHAPRYRRWVALNTPTQEDLAIMTAKVASLVSQPLVSVITPVFDTDPRWLRACIESVRAQAYPRWELCLADDGSTCEATLVVLREYENVPRIRVVHLPRNSGIAAATNAALSVATGEFVAMLDHDDELAPEALYEVVRLLNRLPATDLIYSDEDKLDAAGERLDPHFKPDWSPEHFRSVMYLCHLLVIRASLVRDLGGLRSGVDGAQDYDLVLRVIERTSRVEHIPRVLYHWRKVARSTAGSGWAKPLAITAGQRALQQHVERCGLDAVVLPGPLPGLYRVRHRIVGSPLVSIVIPTAAGGSDRTPATGQLAACLRSIIQNSTYENYEIVLAEDAPPGGEALELLKSVSHCRVRSDALRSSNLARKLNFAVAHSRGTHLVLLNDDIQVIAPEWIEAMLEFSQQEAVGAVGAKLVYPDGRLQHVGVIVGVCGPAAHAFDGSPGGTEGHMASALVVRNYSAVSGACMMTRRGVYEKITGFDEQFSRDFIDIDYCLRIRREGFRVVYTPYAVLARLDAASNGASTWDPEDLATMRRRWADVCSNDPYYNPNLTRDFPDYRVATHANSSS